MTMHNSSHLQRTAKGLRLKVFDSLLTPAFPTLAHPTFNPFVFYRFQKNRGGEGPAQPFVAKRRAGRASPAPTRVREWKGQNPQLFYTKGSSLDLCIQTEGELGPTCGTWHPMLNLALMPHAK